MRISSFILTAGLLWANSFSLKAQSDSLKAQVDTNSTVFTYQKFMSMVKENHPLSRQADLALDRGDAYLLKARGGFDPKLYGDFSQKQFKGDEYYELLDAGLKVPTWFGLAVKAGYENNEGTNLNPENSTPGSGLWYAGIELPIGNGLFIDQRRAELKRAKIFRESSEAQQRIILNDLLYEAGKAYWAWFQSYNDMIVLEEGYELANQRFQGVKNNAIFGDVPIIDTVESWIQVQNRSLELQQFEVEYQNASAYLAVFLWKEGIVPLELQTTTIPFTVEGMNTKELSGDFYSKMDSLIQNHPELLQYQYKVETLEIDARLKREQLKPDLNLKYNAISQPVGGDVFSEYSTNNYNWGVSFSMPIALRKERGDLKLTQIKQNEAQLQMANKREQLSYKATASLNSWRITLDQIELYRQTVIDYNRLLEGERSMFEAGESSLFMVNSREVGYLKARLKLIELMSKNQKARLTANYVYGILNQTL